MALTSLQPPFSFKPYISRVVGVCEQNAGTTLAKYNPPLGKDEFIKSGRVKCINVKYQCISLMKEYKDKSLEELRLEDYRAGRVSKELTFGKFLYEFNTNRAPALNRSPPVKKTGAKHAYEVFSKRFETKLFRPRKRCGVGEQNDGTKLVKYSPHVGLDSFEIMGKSLNVNVKYDCITIMREYEDKSLEELRLEDYRAGRRLRTEYTCFQTNVFVFGLKQNYAFSFRENEEIGNVNEREKGTTVKYSPPVRLDIIMRCGRDQIINVKYNCITIMKEYKNKSMEELRYEDYGAGRKPIPLRFHLVHGGNIKVYKDGTTAERINSHYDGIVFSSRPIRVNEVVYLRLVEISKHWHFLSGINFGFTTDNPNGIAHLIPKFAVPTKSTWITELNRKFCEKGKILHFHVDSAGELHFGVNGHIQNHNSPKIDINRPLWAIIDVYGRCKKVQFVGPKALDEGKRLDQVEDVAKRCLDQDVNGARRPDAGVDGARRSDPGVNGARRSDPGADSDRRPDSGADGARRLDQAVDGARRPDPIVNGARRPDPGADGDRRPDPGADSDRRPDPVVDSARRPDSGAEGDRRSDSGANGERRPDSGADGARRSDPGVDGARCSDPGLDGARRSNTGVDGARRSDTGVDGARRSDTGVDGARRSDRGVDGARRSDPGVDGARCSDPGVDGARRSDTGVDGARRSDRGVDGTRRSDTGVDGDRRPDPGADSDRRPDPVVDSARRPDSGAEGDRRSDSGANGERRPDSGADGARRCDPGVDGARCSDPGVDGARRSNTGVDGARRSDTGVDGARRSDTGVDGARRSDRGVDGARRSDPGVDGARCSDPGVDGARRSDTGVDGARRSDRGVDGTRRSDTGVDGARRSDTGVDGARRSDTGVDGARRSDRGVDGARSSDTGVDGARRSDPGVDGARRSETDVGGARRSDRGVDGARRSETDVGGARRSDRGVDGARRSNQSQVENDPLVDQLRSLSVGGRSAQIHKDPVPLCLHKTKGKNAHFTGRGIAERCTGYCQGYVFTARPFRPGKTIRVQLLNTASYPGSLGIGLTSCNPTTLKSEELPDEADFLEDRPEYWIVHTDAANGLQIGDDLEVTLTRDGMLVINKNGSKTVFYVDHTLKLWAFFDIYGSTQEIKLSISDEKLPESDRNLPSTSGSKMANSLRSECTVCLDKEINCVLC